MIIPLTDDREQNMLSSSQIINITFLRGVIIIEDDGKKLNDGNEEQWYDGKV